MEAVKVRKSDRALPPNQALYEDEDGCPFAAPQKPKPQQPPAAMTEVDFMDADLDALQLGLVKRMVRLSPEQMDEIENERIGADYCNQPWLY